MALLLLRFRRMAPPARAAVRLLLLTLLPGCMGVVLDPFSTSACESDLDCPDAHACRVVSAEGTRSCEPLTQLPNNPGDVGSGGGDGTGGGNGAGDGQGGGGGGGGGAGVPTPVSFCETVKPLMDRYCNSCHGANPVASGVFTMRFDVYDDDADGKLGAKASAPRIKARMSDFKDMPPRSTMPQPTEEERATVGAWVSAGAPFDASGGANGTVCP